MGLRFNPIINRKKTLPKANGLSVNHVSITPMPLQIPLNIDAVSTYRPPTEAAALRAEMKRRNSAKEGALNPNDLE